jgi:hypothetical protein
MPRTSLLRALPLSFALIGCGYGHHDHSDYYYDDYYPSGGYSDICGGTIREGTIDADSPFQVDPGSGVGTFVEYGSGGHWHIYTTCDTAQTNAACNFDLVVTPLDQGQILSVSPENLESNDQLSLAGNIAYFDALTDYDVDGFYVDTDPGVGLRVDVTLDGQCGNKYFYWIGDGAIHQAAPSSPFDLEPSTP